MTKRERLRRAGRVVGPWLLEGIFIVVSVLLGFAAAQYGEDRDNRQLAHRALSSLQTELEFNLAAVEPYPAFHTAYVDALDKVDVAANGESGFQTYLKIRPPLPKNSETDIPLVRRAAWDAAVSSGALRLIDYDLVAGLSEIYQMQAHLGDAAARVPISSGTFFNPGDRIASLRQAQAALNEMVWAEQSLVTLYQKHLPSLKAAASNSDD